VPPEARLYPFAEATTHDNDNDDSDGGAAAAAAVAVAAAEEGGGVGKGQGGVTVVELDFRGELKRCVCVFWRDGCIG
jgi:hypothetical protein